MIENRRRESGWVLIDGARELAAPNNWADLDMVIAQLREIASTPNAICTLVSPSGATLSVGIATRCDRDNVGLDMPLASVTYEEASGVLPYLTILGDESLTYENGGVIVFRFEGEWTEILRRNCVPVETMRRVVRDFFETGAVPTCCMWEEV